MTFPLRLTSSRALDVTPLGFTSPGRFWACWLQPRFQTRVSSAVPCEWDRLSSPLPDDGSPPNTWQPMHANVVSAAAALVPVAFLRPVAHPGWQTFATWCKEGPEARVRNPHTGSSKPGSPVVELRFLRESTPGLSGTGARFLI